MLMGTMSCGLATGAGRELAPLPYSCFGRPTWFRQNNCSMCSGCRSARTRYGRAVGRHDCADGQSHEGTASTRCRGGYIAALGLDDDQTECALCLAPYALVVVDESSQLEGRHLAHLVTLHKAADRVPAIALLGDKWQMAGLGSTRPWETAHWRSEVHSTSLHELYRCKDTEFRRVLNPMAGKIVNLHFPWIYIFARIYIPNLRKLKGKCKSM